MSHLFLETELTQHAKDNRHHIGVRRTGKVATILNLSYFEPETVQRVFNEIFLLLTNPELDTN